MPTRLVRIASLDQLAPGQGVAVAVANGTLRGATVACAGCGWEYDVRTGAVRGVPALRIDTFEVTVVESVVMLAVEPAWPPNA